MSEIDGLVVHHEEFTRAIGQYAVLTGKSLEEQFADQVKKIVRDVVAQTPPLGRSGSMTVTRGNVQAVLLRRVKHEMLRVLKPVDLKGFRRIPLLFGKEHPSAPWVVPTYNKDPNALAIYRNHRRMTKGQRAKNYKRKYYVSRPSFDAAVKEEVKKFGRLGAGFAPAANLMKVGMPAFTKKHGASGSAYFYGTMNFGLRKFQFTNSVPYVDRVTSMRPRIDRVVRDRIGAMERQIPFLLRRHERLVN